MTAADTVGAAIDFPASLAQRRMWFLHKLDPADSSYNVPLLLRLRGAVSPDALASAVADLVARQEQLRTSFLDVDGEVQQRVHPAADVRMRSHRIDAPGVADADLVAHPAVAAVLRQVIDPPFDLAVPGAIRVDLVELGPDDRLLVVVVHHIIIDGWSLRVLLTELDAYYRARVDGTTPTLPELTVQYADYAEWQRTNLDRAALDAELAQWARLFPNGLSGQVVPLDRARPAAPSSQGARYEFDIDAGVAASAHGLARRDGATLYMVLLAAWAATVGRAGDTDTVTLATLLANRDNPQVVDLIGLFVNTLPVPVDLTGEPTFAALVARVRQAGVHVFAHQDTPTEEIVTALRRDGDDRGDAMPLLFALQNFAEQQIRFGGRDVAVTRIDEDERSTRFELELHVWEHPDRLHGALVYSTDLFRQSTIARLADAYTAVLRHGCAEPDTPVHRIPLPQRAILTASPIPSTNPDSQWPPVADTRAAAVTRYEAELHRAGVRPGDVVATAGSARSFDTVVAVAAILRRGGVWLPLDPRDPATQLAAALSGTDYAAAGVFAVGFPPPRGQFLPRPAEVGPGQAPPAVDLPPDAPALLAASPAGRVAVDRRTLAAHADTLRHWFPGDRTRVMWLGESALPADIIWAAGDFADILDTPAPAGADLALGSAAELADFSGTAVVVGMSGTVAAHAHTVYGDERAGWTIRLDPDGIASVRGELSVRTRDGAVAPHGFRGAIHLDGAPTGLRGTLVDATLRVDGERADSAVWTGRRLAAADDVRRGPLALGPLREAAVLDRVRVDGVRECVAYVTRTSPIDADAVLRRLRANAPHDLIPAAVVALPAALPLTPDGALDTAALRRIPVCDRVETERLSALAAAAGATTVAVRPAPAPEPARLPVPTTAPAAAVGDQPALADGGPQPDPRFDSLAEALRAAAAGSHGTRHLRAEAADTDLTYRGLLAEATALAGVLIAAGCRRGDPVLVQCRDTEDYLVAVWAAFLAGAAAAPLAVPGDFDTPSPALTRLLRIRTLLDQPILLAGRHEFASLCAHSELSAHVVAVRPAAPEPVTALPELGPDDVALVLFTSGSTGEPKGVELTHGNILRRSASVAAVEDFDEPYTSFNWMPLDHVGGIVMWHLRDVYHGVDQIHAPTDWILADPLRWLDTIDRYRVTSTWAPNFAFGLIAEHVGASPARSWDLSSLRIVLNGGEAIAPRVAAAFVDRLSPHGLPADALAPAWGMSETSSGVVYSRRFRSATAVHAAAMSLGRPIPGCRIRIVDHAGTVLRAGEVGRLQVAGGTVTRGYRQLPAENAAAFGPDDWFDTGDLAVIDADGELSITGRAKDVIIVNGVNYPCHEIEAAVDRLDCTLTSWSAACAVRESDTESVAIFFRPNDTATVSDAVAAVRAVVVAAVGVSPAAVVPLPDGAITKTGIGKIVRSTLRERYERGEFDDVAVRLPATEAKHPADTVTDHFFHLRWTPKKPAPDPTPRPLTAVVALGARPGLPPHAVVIDDTDAPAKVLAKLSSALGHCRTTPDATVAVITTAAFAVDGEANPTHAAAAALLETARAEFDTLRIRHIDTAPTVPAAELDRELASAPADPVVALREHRQVPRVARIDEPLDAEPPRAGEFYLVTGGRGGVGTLLTDYLRRRYGLRLLVVGRSPAPPDSAGVRHAIVDCADAEALRRCVAGAEKHFGTTLDGVVHLAGQFAERALPDTGAADFDAALDAKAATAAAAMALGADRPGLRWIGFSSVNATFGGAHAGAYAAANAYLDALTGGFAARGHRAQSIGWSTWHGVGLSSHNRLTDIADASGYRALDPAEALLSLDVCLRRGNSRPLVGLDPTAARVAALLDSAPPPSNHLILHVDSAARDRVRESLGVTRDRFGTRTRVDVVSTDNTDDPRAATGGELDATVAAVFGQALTVDDCGIHDNFFDLGGNSVTAIRAHALLIDRLDRRFPLAELYRNPTPYLLARALHPPEQPRTAASRVAARAHRRRAARR